MLLNVTLAGSNLGVNTFAERLSCADRAEILVNSTSSHRLAQAIRSRTSSESKNRRAECYGIDDFLESVYRLMHPPGLAF